MPRWTKWIGKLGLCLGPLALTPLLVLLIGEGYLDFGGGEKDLILVLPWLLWSLLYAIAFAVGWSRKLPLKRTLSYAAGGAAIVVVSAWAALLIWTLV